MIHLLLASPDPGETALAHRFGGRPWIPRGHRLEWPHCRSCTGAMQYLGRLWLSAEPGREAQFALLFQCENEPGACPTWEAEEGANAVLLVGADDLVPVAEIPTEGVTLREGEAYGLTVRAADYPKYGEALGEWSAAHEMPPRTVQGQWQGESDWIQGDQTPACPHCGAGMSLLAQLEEGPPGPQEMNFGGGCAFVFVCRCRRGEEMALRILWQC